MFNTVPSLRPILVLSFAVATATAAGVAGAQENISFNEHIRPILADNCFACHGADAKGNQALGAPNLTDKVWLHGWGEEVIVSMVTKGKLNQMPAQEGRLTPSQIHVLSAYVWGLSNTSTQKP